jgi:prepilin-type N-terminal cleavage/methylation domain-containing protein
MVVLHSILLVHILYEGSSLESGFSVEAESSNFMKNFGQRMTHPARKPNNRAMTLVEIMVAVAIIVVAALGTLCYEYLCVDQVHFARAQLAATRVGQLLLEDWKSTGGSPNYNPQDLQMGFTLPPELPAGTFMTVIDDLPLYITMDSDTVSEAGPFVGELSKISVVVRWRSDFGQGALSDDDPSIVLTTYVRRDQ